MKNKDQRGTILVGHSKELFQLYANLKHPEWVLGVFCPDGVQLPVGLERLGEVDMVPAYLPQNASVLRVYCAMTEIDLEQVRRIQQACTVRDTRFCLAMPMVDELALPLTEVHVARRTLYTPVREPLSHLHNRFLKRLFDLTLTLVFLLTLFPVIYLCRLPGIKRRQRGPSVVTDRCCGPNGRVFSRVSFRFDEHSWATILNVLTGSMSLVGPSCYVLNEEQEPDNLPVRLERKMLKAGMTGWARVNHIPEEERLQADIYYAEHWSLWLDIRILFKSVFA